LALAKEESIEGLARGAATLASRCGSCHLATTSITTFSWTEAPADDGDSKARMQRHLWAMDRLWEGLVGPSEMSWQEGTVVLLAAPFPVDRLPVDAKSQADAKVQLAKIAALAQKAKGAVEAEDRMAVYGELLGTCSGCHTKNR
jgi:mono/diheme cytochrome c family protein